MDFFDVVQKRRSVRAYSSQCVRDADIEKILRAASLAPTARNVQPWHFIVVKDEAKRRELARLAPNGVFLAQAPVCLVVFCEETKYYLEDGCAATAQALLAASALGLGACWIAGDKKEYAGQIRDLLGAPASMRLVSLISLGYAREVAPVEKRPFSGMLHKDMF